MPTLLLELFSEEIPSRMQRAAAEQLERLIAAGLEKNLLKPMACKTFVSPRHLAIQVMGLPATQPDTREERRGPKLGAPEQALKGFLQSTGLTAEQCEQRDGYYYATIERKGRAVADVIKEICQSALADFSWPKSMRWGARPLNWVRPLHRIICLLDTAVVPLEFTHLTASNVTEGHRFLSPAPITIAHAEQYEEILKNANVIVDFAARREKIAADIAAVASAAKLTVVEDEALLNEVTGLVEWPVPLLCQFDAKFLDLPREVLISEMKNHQRYFALNDASGNLSTRFITVANMVNEDGGAKVIEGNGRVVRARLSDGEFYWNQDRLVSLQDWGKKLSDVVFHAKVGMMDAKVARIEKLALEIAKAVGFSDANAVQRAALLCKADLTSGMVGEFPELQGIMGRYYAMAQGESAAIADAIRDHYKPLGAGDSLPESELAAIIAIADKLDSIVSLFAAGEKPTGSKDPLALRRAALGILRIILDSGYSVELDSLIAFHYLEVKRDLLKVEGNNLQNKSLNLLKKEAPEIAELHTEILRVTTLLTDGGDFAPNDIAIIYDIIEFFKERIKQLMRDGDLPAMLIEARISKKRLIPKFILDETKALAAWLPTASGAETTTAIKRTLNLLAAEEKKAKTTFAATGFASLALPAEKAIITALTSPFKTPADLEALTAPINAFFDAVLVTEPEFRDARLSLLAAVRDAANTIADFSKIEG